MNFLLEERGVKEDEERREATKKKRSTLVERICIMFITIHWIHCSLLSKWKQLRTKREAKTPKLSMKCFPTKRNALFVRVDSVYCQDQRLAVESFHSVFPHFAYDFCHHHTSRVYQKNKLQIQITDFLTRSHSFTFTKRTLLFPISFAVFSFAGPQPPFCVLLMVARRNKEKFVIDEEFQLLCINWLRNSVLTDRRTRCHDNRFSLFDVKIVKEKKERKEKLSVNLASKKNK